MAAAASTARHDARRSPAAARCGRVANFHDDAQNADADLCRRALLGQPRDVLRMWPMQLRDGRINLQPLSTVWITDG